MANGIDKKALFNLKSEPYLKPISDLGVGFYNLDENTAILRFQLSNTEGPLLIHESNLIAYAYFESSNGSVSDVIELEIEDSFNGIVTITLDKEFLQASTSTKVKGQVYIGVNNVNGNPEYNEVAVFREFNFEVADALINKISAFTKIEYIRMFDQLKMRIEQKVRDIEEAIANGADYVAEMQSVLQRGVETLNAIVADGKSDIQAYITQAKTDLDITKDNAVNDITTTSNNAKTSVTETADGVIENINNVSNNATEHIDGKVVEFNGLLETGGFLTPEELGTQLEELEWQKYKLTNDDGTSVTLTSPVDLGDTVYLSSLTPGEYYAPGPTNSPNGASGFLTVLQRSTVKVIYFQPYNQDRLFVNRYYKEWSGWKELTNSTSDTGWIPFTLINGALSNTSYKQAGENGFDCAYRTIKNDTATKRIVRLNGKGVTHGQVIAQLPSTFCKNDQTFTIRVPVKYSGAFVTIKNNGEINLYIQGDRSDWNENDLFYGEFSWYD